MPSVPAYGDLPRIDGVSHSWGVWGHDDRFGALNNIDNVAVMRGLHAARTGRVFSANWSMNLPAPQLFGRPDIEHVIVEGGFGALNDVVSKWNTQSSSQWDGFRHVQWYGHGVYNGLASEQHGVQHWSRRPIVTRAVLIDVGRWRAAQGRPIDFARQDLIEASDLTSTLAATGVTVEAGDIFLIRTGWVEWYEGLDAAGRERLAQPGGLIAPGLAGREEIAELFWNHHVAAVAADNPALEVWPQGAHLSAEVLAEIAQQPERRHEASLHIRLLPALGIPIGEFWDLSAIAADCAADGVFAMCLTSAPINLYAAAATPANAILIK